jgi:hypothetical protein
MFSYSFLAFAFGALSSNSNPAYFVNTSQSPSAFNSSTILYVGGATTKGALNSTTFFELQYFLTFELIFSYLLYEPYKNQQILNQPF